MVVRIDAVDIIFSAEKLNFQLEPITTDKLQFENEKVAYLLAVTLPDEISGHIIEINLFHKDYKLENNKATLLATYTDPLIIDDTKLIILHLPLYPIKILATPDWMKRDSLNDKEDKYLGE